MATLSEMRDDIKSDLIIVGSTDYDAQIDNKIRAALRLMRGKRFWFLHKTDTITLLTSTSSVALPTDFSTPDKFRLSAGGAWLSDGRGFDYLTYDKMKRDRANATTLTTGQPTACSTMNSTLHVDTIANADYTIQCTYWRQDATLPSANGDTSVWFDEGYDVIRTQAVLLFKGEAEGFSITQRDNSAADFYYSALAKTSQAREGGR